MIWLRPYRGADTAADIFLQKGFANKNVLAGRERSDRSELDRGTLQKA